MDPLNVPILPVHHQSTTDTVPRPKAKPTKSFIMLTIISVCVTVGLVSQKETPVPLRYSVIIDAGSSGTRVHVFGYQIKSDIPVVDVYEKSSADIGLSTYARDPSGATSLIDPLVTFAMTIVPEEYVRECEIRLMATAGMRLLKPKVREQILQVTRGVFRSSGFKFQNEWASVISGADEGLYAWVVANYALGSLADNRVATKGIVELGGASAQVTFVPSGNVPPEYNNMMDTITFGGASHRLYTHSFLNFGRDEALKKLRISLRNSTKDGTVKDPCTPKGYSPSKNSHMNSSRFLVEDSKFTATLEAAGNYEECRAAALSMLTEGNEKCAKNCYIGSTLTPELEGNFFALGNFYYTSEFFKLEEEDWVSKMISAGEEFCGKEWWQLKEKYPTTKDKYLSRYCFSSAYIVAMLRDRFGLSDERITSADKAGDDNLPLDWALGAFILTSATNNSESRQKLAFTNLPIFKL